MRRAPRAALLLATCGAASGCADVALPASAYLAPRPAPITQVLVQKPEHRVIPIAGRFRGRIPFHRYDSSPSARPALLFVDGRAMTWTELRGLSLARSDVINVVLLKGRDAVPIYGEAAADGVVILTTRRGAAGR